MSVFGLLFACVIGAAPGEADRTREGKLRPRRDLFGTAARRTRKGSGAPARVWGTVELSDGTRTRGWLSLTPGRPLEVYDLERKEWREFELHEIAGLRATPRREELEREWRWKEYGKDEKVYTGRAYPKRWLDHEIVLRRRQDQEDGQDGEVGERVSCHIRGAVLYLTTEPPRGEKAPERRRYILRQYERGKLGQTLEDLAYVRRVSVHERGAGRRSPAAERPSAGKVEELVGELQAADLRARERAAGALVDLGPEAKAAVPTLVRVLRSPAPEGKRSHLSRQTRRKCAQALGGMGSAAASAASALEDMVDDRGFDMRVEAALALFRITGKPERPLALMLEALEDGLVRYDAIGALGQMGAAAAAAIPALERIAGSKTPWLDPRYARAVKDSERERAARALQAIRAAVAAEEERPARQ